MAIQSISPEMPPFALPTFQRALKVADDCKVILQAKCPLPEVGDEDVLVRVICIALNPVDGKSVEMSPTPGATVGCDFSGEVVKFEDAVSSDTDRPLHVGSRVCGCVFGNNPVYTDNGAFAEYVAVPARLVFHIPDDMSFQSAATLGVGLATTGLALYQGLGLPRTWKPATSLKSAPFVLVSGGGTATGALAIQIIKLSGLQPITTSAPHSFDRLKRLGAVATFDYRSPTCGTDIREFTDNRLAFALDCQADTASMIICYEAIGSAGGRYIALNPFPLRAHRRRSVQPGWVFMFTQFAQPIPWQRPYNVESKPRDKDFAIGWYEEVQKLLDAGAIVPFPYQEKSGGLTGAINGMDLVNRGKVAGYKCVYSIAKA